MTSDAVTYVLTWTDGDPVASLLSIDAGDQRLHAPLLRHLAQHVRTEIPHQDNLRRVSFTGPPLDSLIHSALAERAA